MQDVYVIMRNDYGNTLFVAVYGNNEDAERRKKDLEAITKHLVGISYSIRKTAVL